jgi:heme-degrading monooxygenase HmoA
VADTDSEAGYAIAFEYLVPQETRAAFERTYGSAGDWARFFGQDPSYLGTELWALGDDDGRYLLFDRWRSAEDYRAFRTRHRDEYDRRSAENALLYASERLIGEMLRR